MAVDRARPKGLGTGKKTMHEVGEEMYRYNMVIPVRVFRLVQEVAWAENRTIIFQLTAWIKEGYTRWKVAKDAEEAKRLEESRLVNVFKDDKPKFIDFNNL